MENKTKSTKFLRQRKFLLALPLLTFPFLTMICWSLGIFKSNAAIEQKTIVNKGFNTAMPGAVFKEEKGQDKMSFYNAAAKDSLKTLEQLKTDPYYHKDTVINAKNERSIQIEADPNETKVYAKLQQLNSVMNQQQQTAPANNKTSTPDDTHQNSSSPDIIRLEKMMQAIKQGDGENKEMNQLNGMMDKILDMQHPERVQERIKEQSSKNKQQVFPVEAAAKTGQSTLIQHGDTIKNTKYQNSFYGWDNQLNSNSNETHSIEAVIHETQILVAGTTVKLRLTNDIYINGLLIPKNNFIYGTASLNGERLQISIVSIRYENHLLPVSLTVYDMDGLIGIHIPGSINRDVSKESANEAITGVGMTTLDPSLAAQATSAGIQAAKSLLSKKVKLVKVTVKAGYSVLLKDNNQKQ